MKDLTTTLQIGIKLASFKPLRSKSSLPVGDILNLNLINHPTRMSALSALREEKLVFNLDQSFLKTSSYLEDIFESTVVALQDGVLGGHVEGPLLLKGGHEGGVSEVGNRLVGVVHACKEQSILDTQLH